MELSRTGCGRLARVPNDPLAYFITFRTYGTWLPGDGRGTMDRNHNKRGEPPLSRDDFRRESARRKLAGVPVTLSPIARICVDASVRETCLSRGWQLHALNVRTNHVHLTVSAEVTPERVMEAAKAWATRRLREAGLATPDAPVWSRHGSTKRLWREAELEAATEYVMNGQD